MKSIANIGTIVLYVVTILFWALICTDISYWFVHAIL